MNFNRHSEIEGRHALLSPSRYHWIRYDPDKMAEVYYGYLAAEKGTKLHAVAADLIRMKLKLAKQKKTINLYVNDCIQEDMTPEQPLVYSKNCFGTADAISFFNGALKIFDFKTGEVPAHMEQLQIYAALFCLEYHVNPEDILMELRIYQTNEVQMFVPQAEDIRDIMNKIIDYDALIEDIRMKEVTA